MKRFIVSLVLIISSSLMSGQSAQTPTNGSANDGISPTQPAQPIKNYRSQLYHASPAGDKEINHDLRKHIRQLNREERHLRRELRRLRRERAVHPPGR
jgi:hypothetical protein